MLVFSGSWALLIHEQTIFRCLPVRLTKFCRSHPGLLFKILCKNQRAVISTGNSDIFHRFFRKNQLFSRSGYPEFCQELLGRQLQLIFE